MGSINLTTVEKIFKIKYPDGVEPLLFDEDPAIEWVPKDSRFGGKQREVTPRTSGIRGANDYADAVNGVSSPEYVTYTIKRGADYTPISIDCETIAAADTDPGALEDAMKEGTECAVYEHGRARSSELWGNGRGARGTIGSIATDTITLAEPHYARFFEQKMLVKLAPTESYAAVHANELEVLAVDTELGTVKFLTDVVATIPAAANGNFLFRKGTKRPMLGFFAWCPYADVGLGDALYTSFQGVNRTVSPQRLTGIHVDGGGANMEDVLVDLITKVRDNGGRPNTVWMNTQDFGRLKKELGSKEYIDMASKKGVAIGFKGIPYNDGQGDLMLRASPDCRRGHFLATRRESWLLSLLRTMGHFVDEDGKKWRHERSEDNVQAVMRTWGNLICNRTNDNGSGKW